jgi:CBS domain-containing protein
MKVREIMSRPPIYVYADTPLWRAARCMQDNDSGFLPVVRGGDVVGVVTSRDIASRGCAEGLSPTATSVAQIMSRPAVEIDGDMAPEDAAILMRQWKVHRLVVTNSRREPIGVVTLGDLSGYLEDASIVKTLNRLNENSGPDSHNLGIPTAPNYLLI